MKTSTITKTLGLVALLGSSATMAATVTITPSGGGLYNVDDTFTLTMTADAPNTFAATFRLAFDATKVAFVSGAALAPWNVFTKNSPVTENPAQIDVETPTATALNPGVYNVAILTFKALAAGSGQLITIDDDGNQYIGFVDALTADPIASTYSQANITIQGAVVPAPATLGLLATALGGLVLRRKRAA